MPMLQTQSKSLTEFVFSFIDHYSQRDFPTARQWTTLPTKVTENGDLDDNSQSGIKDNQAGF